MIEFYGWKRIMFLNQDESLFTGNFALFVERMTKLNLNITVGNVELPTQNPIHLPPSELFNLAEDFRVFFINSYSGVARKIICEAAKLNLTYPRYAWLTFGWYPFGWWLSDGTVDCTDQQLAAFMERSLALQIFPNPDDRSASTDTGLTPDEFYEKYVNRTKEAFSIDLPHVSPLAYDAVWALAIALNRTANMATLPVDVVMNKTNCPVQSNAIDQELVPLENFTYANFFMGCVIRWNLAQTNFEGVSGRMLFDDSGSRVQIKVTVRQYRKSNGSSHKFDRVRIGFIASAKDNVFNYMKNETDLTTYPNGIPPDGTPINKTVTYHLALVVIYDIIASLGLIFTTVCLVFNFAYRNRKIIRLTSPNLNYFIILGCYIIFISVFFGTIPSKFRSVIKAQCHMQIWLSIIGYTMAFATILSKMIRVFHIFNNPTAAKKEILTDWHLVIAILSMTSFSVLLLIMGSAILQLRPAPSLRRNDEHLTGRNELGVRIEFFTWECYSSNAFYWLIVIFVYLVFLQVIGFILAVRTRKVKIKALNDSKFVAAVIYVTSIVLLLMVVVTFALSRYRNVAEVVFSGALMLGTTAFLCLMFVPKMASLYHDPMGKDVFGKTNATSTVEIGKSGNISIKSKLDDDKVLHLESKIKELENRLIIANATGLEEPHI